MEDRLFYSGVALVSACSWALGAILWRQLGEQLSSYSMNLSKTVLGTFFLGFALLFIGLEPIDTISIFFLALSGVLGIAVGDTFFFLSLMELGPRRASLMGSLNPVVIALAAALFLGERPTSLIWLGIVATTFGVGWVLRERSATRSTNDGNHRLGICYGLLSVLCTMIGVLLAKIGVAHVPTVQATWIRLFAGAIGLVFWGAYRSELGKWLVPFQNKTVVKKVIFVVTVVVIGGFWMSMLALKHIDAAIAGTLNSTGPIFILPMAMVFMKEKLSVRAILGAVIAVTGVALILHG